MSTLFEEIGGETSIRLLVTTFYQHVLADSVLRPFFDEVPIERLKRMQLEFFRVALGGEDSASDFDLYKVHSHLNLKVDHLTRFTDHLLSTLREIGIEEEQCKKVHQRIATYANDVLGDSTVDG